MRKRLKEARESKSMTQQQVADLLDLTVRYYQKIESGDVLGSVPVWDSLEDIFGINQRELRRQVQEGNQ